MLASLSIRDVVLIERLDIAFRPGLCVLTGETGAGKSILLDALGLTLGERADARLVRQGAERALVGAEFDLAGDHPVFALLREAELPDDGLVVRRSIATDGRSRAFVNDQPASVGLLRQIGDMLVEVQGQHDQRGLMDPATHRPLLDGYGQSGPKLSAVATAWHAWRDARTRRETMAADVEQTRRDEDWLRHTVDELTRLDPKPGEEEALAAARATSMNQERIAEALKAAQSELSGGRGVDAALRSAQRSLERAADKAGGLFDAALAALDRAAVEIGEASNEIAAAAARLESGTGRPEEIEERLFALRAAARKHDVPVDRLPELRHDLAERLSTLEDQGDLLDRLVRAEAAARAVFVLATGELTSAREATAASLDRAIAAELAPLKLDRAKFRTRIEPLPEPGWGSGGVDRVTFEISTNPGAPFGPLARIASGGELSRIMLALKVALATAGSARTLIFDEVDAGVGGAVAAAVGARLARLAASVQILVVTHSPQVAAQGEQHLQVVKRESDGVVGTIVAELDAAARREEIARMLSGARVTDEARAAAESLMAHS